MTLHGLFSLGHLKEEKKQKQKQKMDIVRFIKS
jgi:hypothetical protein